VLPMLDAGQDLPLGRSITFEFVRNDHAGNVLAPVGPENPLQPPIGP
jgi:hypothetical protein